MLSKHLRILCQIICLFHFCLPQIKAQSCDRDDPYTIICTGIRDKFPSLNISSNYHWGTFLRLECIACNIPEISSNTIGNFRGQSIDLSNSSIRTVQEGAFQNVGPTLSELSLQQNDINDIGLEVFKKFTNLDLIDLSKNNLASLKSNQFETVTVRELDLSYNYIETIDNAFDSFTVQTLNLTGNKIKTLKSLNFAKTTFSNMFINLLRLLRKEEPQKSSLLLAHNLIKELSADSFTCTGQLHVLDVSNNRISKIDSKAFHALANLKILQMGSNKISELPTDVFDDLRNLETLDLSNNSLKILPLGLFKNLNSLIKLTLNNNNIKTISTSAFSGLISLQILEISHNKIKDLSVTELFLLGRIRELNLEGNRLHSLAIKEILAHNKELKKINLNENFWSCKMLMEIYSEINKKFGELTATSSHFDVPNLHGIACSRQIFDIPQEMTFEEFLKHIAIDSNLDEMNDVEFRVAIESTNAAEHNLEYLKKIYNAVLLMAIISVVLIICLLAICILNIFNKGKYFSKKEDKIELIYQS